MYKDLLNKISHENSHLYTFCMLKPDAIKRNIIGEVITMLEKKFTIIGIYMQKFTNEKASKFYEVHKERFFFNDLVKNITAGCVCGMILKIKEDNLSAVLTLREYMGNTDPKNAEAHTIRNKHGISIDENTVHGSDSSENFLKEAALFFGTHNE